MKVQELASTQNVKVWETIDLSYLLNIILLKTNGSIVSEMRNALIDLNFWAKNVQLALLVVCEKHGLSISQEEAEDISQQIIS